MTFVAWEVTTDQMPESTMAYSAQTRGRAMYESLKDAREAGYDFRFFDFKAVRAPQFDHKAADFEGCLGWKDRSSQWGCYLTSDQPFLEVPDGK